MVVAAALRLLLACAAEAGAVSPRHGGPLPEAFLHRRQSKSAYLQIKRGWTGKRTYLFRPRFAFARGAQEGFLTDAVAGRLDVPVVLGRYRNTPEEPVRAARLEQEFFTGPWPTGTLNEYYAEVSYGQLEVTGTVFDWAPLAENEVYYTGGFGVGVVPGLSHTGALITELLDHHDPAVDFGSYDNDGPDGVPNSGDDDGFVDVLVVVHSTEGWECNEFSYHMWSHSWVLSAWPEAGNEPYQTDDPATGGGVIRVDDYIICPSLSCEDGMIEIGVYCHELGHTLGLPDLYDYTLTSYGIGDWGLMGRGNWNTPASPAHLCAWSREQLGWIRPREIGWEGERITLDPVAAGGEVLKFVLPTRRFRRRQAGTGFALVCGYTEAEAAARGWPGGAGYGNMWRESMIREFHVDGSRPVTLEYDIVADTEVDYDFGYLLLERAAGVETLAVYNGSIALSESFGLDGFLPPGACDFVLRFFFASDRNISDEDGRYDAQAERTYAIDNVRLAGGGIDYGSDFELDAGGWREDAEPAEYFLAANRSAYGFDKHLPGAGLLFWHAENSIAYGDMANSGGSQNDRARGVVLEEADGRFDLLDRDGNAGDGGDPFPGSSGNTSFAALTVPSSRTNAGVPTPVEVTEIDRPGIKITGVFTGGMWAPVVDTVDPGVVDKGTQAPVVFDISGAFFDFDAGCILSRPGWSHIEPNSIVWLGPAHMFATFRTRALAGGSWTLLVINGDGQQGGADLVVISAFDSAAVSTGRDFIRLEWVVNDDRGDVSQCAVYRSENGGDFELLGSVLPGISPHEYEFKDGTVVPARAYAYEIIARFAGGGEEPLLLPGPYRITDLPFIADNNYPNPFNSSTTIQFFTPERMEVAIDIYDVSGRLVYSYGRRSYERGIHRFVWEPGADEVSSGLYFCVFGFGGRTESVKMVLLR